MNYTFLECKFEACYFEGVLSKETSFQDVQFDGCKMVGFNFSLCNNFLFDAIYFNCNLEYSIFSNFNLKNIKFKDCKLIHADFENSV